MVLYILLKKLKNMSIYPPPHSFLTIVLSFNHTMDGKSLRRGQRGHQTLLTAGGRGQRIWRADGRQRIHPDTLGLRGHPKVISKQQDCYINHD